MRSPAGVLSMPVLVTTDGFWGTIGLDLYMNWFYRVNGQVITRRETRGSCVYIGGR